MLFASRLPLDAQAETLVSFLAAGGHMLVPADAVRLCRELPGMEKKAAAKYLRRRLAEHGIRLKHTNGLHVIGKLAGRAGAHDPRADAPRPYRLTLAGLSTTWGWDVQSDDPHELLGLMCEALRGHLGAVTEPLVVEMQRSARGFLVKRGIMQEGGFAAILGVTDALDWAAWFKFCDAAVERLRRVLEEGSAPVFCDGYVLCCWPSSKREGAREIAVYDHDLEMGRGQDLRALELMEAEAGDAMLEAKVDGNRIEAGRHVFYLSEKTRQLEPSFEFSERTFVHPESDSLVRRYRLFRRKVGQPLAALKLSGGYSPGDGLPKEIPVDWAAVKAAQEANNTSLAALAERAGSTSVAEAIIARPRTVDLTTFAQLATALEAKDFNALVAKPSWASAWAVVEPELRSALYAIDEVRFNIGSQFEPRAHAELTEAARELATSRQIRQMERAKLVSQELGEVVYAGDGEEFLAVAKAHNAEVRMAVMPFFMPAEGYELPAVGRRLVLILRPRQPNTQEAHG